MNMTALQFRDQFDGEGMLQHFPFDAGPAIHRPVARPAAARAGLGRPFML
jgi:hypothetical protein